MQRFKIFLILVGFAALYAVGVLLFSLSFLGCSGAPSLPVAPAGKVSDGWVPFPDGPVIEFEFVDASLLEVALFRRAAGEWLDVIDGAWVDTVHVRVVVEREDFYDDHITGDLFSDVIEVRATSMRWYETHYYMEARDRYLMYASHIMGHVLGWGHFVPYGFDYYHTPPVMMHTSSFWQTIDVHPTAITERDLGHPADARHSGWFDIDTTAVLRRAVFRSIDDIQDSVKAAADSIALARREWRDASAACLDSFNADVDWNDYIIDGSFDPDAHLRDELAACPYDPD